MQLSLLILLLAKSCKPPVAQLDEMARAVLWRVAWLKGALIFPWVLVWGHVEGFWDSRLRFCKALWSLGKEGHQALPDCSLLCWLPLALLRGGCWFLPGFGCLNG